MRISKGLHPDIQVIALNTGEGSTRVSISIDAIRDMQREASLQPFEGRYRVFIVDGAELLWDAAANSMLKTLEEPPPQVIILLKSAVNRSSA